MRRDADGSLPRLLTLSGALNPLSVHAVHDRLFHEQPQPHGPTAVTVLQEQLEH